MNNENQPAPATTQAIEEVPAAANQSTTPPENASPWTMPMMLVLFLALMYFTMIRPQRRRERERRQMIEQLRVGSKVIFAGGLVGTIVSAAEKTFVIETSPGTQLEVLRTAVQDAFPAENAKAQ